MTCPGLWIIGDRRIRTQAFQLCPSLPSLVPYQKWDTAQCSWSVREVPSWTGSHCVLAYLQLLTPRALCPLHPLTVVTLRRQHFHIISCLCPWCSFFSSLNSELNTIPRHPPYLQVGTTRASIQSGPRKTFSYTGWQSCSLGDFSLCIHM